MRANLRTILASVITLIISGSPSYALVYDFSFDGTVTSVDSDLQAAGAPGIGTSVSGSFQYDTSTAQDPVSKPGEAVYPTSQLPYSLSFGPLQFGGVGQLGVQNVGVDVSNNYLGSSEDHFTFSAFTGPGEAPVTGSGTTIGGYKLTQLGVALTDSTGTVFNSVALPIILLISSFDDRLVRVFYFDESIGAHRHFDAEINSFSLAPVSAVPLSAALPLYATGLGVMGLLAWYRKRKNAAAIAAA